MLDITNEVKSNTKIFVDDAKVKMKIEDEEDVEELQEDIERLFDWQEKNSMKFNGSKFQLLRYGPNEEIKDNTLYFTGGMEEVIGRVSSCRDLGVIMSDTGRFDDHIDKVTRTVRQRTGWIMRTFYTRRENHMKHLWKTLVQCHLDYCSQLYKPGHVQGMMALEKCFYDFTSRIIDIKNHNYWTRLVKLQMLSQERRMERYRIMYIWKILEGLAPNSGVELMPSNPRLGRQVRIPRLKSTGRQSIQTLREHSFHIDGARLFNCIPQDIRDITKSKDDFKAALDQFLSTIPDHPKMGSLIPAAVCTITGRHSNSLLAWTLSEITKQ